ncbi:MULTISPECIES: DUF6757 family protein [unclassified Halorhabdus]|uniref:DUF6757 family protein n=1 Tax=unclassified Halorhabdus TaxID=2621901 RepID=UPI0018A6B967|nr:MULTISPECIES: DUF6757 family protein [unclassified Halorhabdus]
MQCHYCDRGAEVAVEKDALKVGLCEEHFHQRMSELADGDWIAGVEDDLDLDIDRS